MNPTPPHCTGRRSASWVAAALVGAGLFGGCKPQETPGTVPVDSRLFQSLQLIGSRGTAPGYFTKPRSLVCDAQDNLYVADMTGRIQKFSPEGEFLLQWQMPQTDLGKPKGLGLDREGYIVVLEPHYQRVNHFQTNGTLVYQWGIKGTNHSEFILPRGIAQNADGVFYLSEYTLLERVQGFAADRLPGRRDTPIHPAPAPFAVWGSPGTGPGEFNRAEGLCIGPGESVCVADSCNHRIQIFDARGKFLRQYGKPGSNPGELSYPYDIKVDALGFQYVCEFGNSRVSVFDSKDSLVEVLGRAGREPGEFFNPWSVCLDGQGNLYVADSQNHRVQKFRRREPLKPRPSEPKSTRPGPQ